MGDVVVYSLVFCIGIFVGLTIRSWLYSRSRYDGAIYVNTSPDKIVYSLELDDDPEKIEFKKRVVLKVKSSYQSLDRD